MGRSLITRLVNDGHEVRALVREGSEHKLPDGCEGVVGSAFKPREMPCRGFDTFVHLVGTPHPAPWKGRQFREVDGASLNASVAAAAERRIAHFVYVSVAHPAPVMRSYIEVRTACERQIRDAGLRTTILRPWYVLGPGHRWPYALLPFYKLAERLPKTREAATRLGLVKLDEIVSAMAWAIANPPSQTTVLSVPEIRATATLPPDLRAPQRVPRTA